MPIRYCSEFFFILKIEFDFLWTNLHSWFLFILLNHFYTFPNSISLVNSIQRNFSDISRLYDFSRQKCRQIILESHPPLFFYESKEFGQHVSFPRNFPRSCFPPEKKTKCKIETSLFSIQDSPSNWSSGQVLTLFCFKYRSPLRPTMWKNKFCKKIRIFKQLQSFGEPARNVKNLPDV